MLVSTCVEYLRELVLTNDENGLEDLPSEDLGLNERDGLAVEADETLALLAVGDGGGRLLLAEARNGRSGHDDCGVCKLEGVEMRLVVRDSCRRVQR